ncbi:MAG: multiple sugar transport system ATP-binding protein, partial [Solirubrobacteraceae bacterium]|nr:multiple sugar transport system ATP-binding protein [Solirubrobacteraceae bacterium]
EFDDVVKRYPDGFEAVKNMDLEIRDGELMILVGPSGCGKSTALRMIAGLEDISEGDLKIGGEVVNDLAPKDRDIAMVFQNYALYPHMTVRENMGFALKLRKEDPNEISRRVNDAAKILDLEQHLDRKPANLSGGQRQRVAMGRAIVREPKAFLMDEPLSNLDAKLRVEMRAAVSRLQQRLETTTVYVTHDQTEAMTLGDRVAVMRAGILQQVDSPRELYDNPRNIFVAGFIGSPAMNFFSGTIENDGIQAPMGSIPLNDQLRRALESHGTGKRDVVIGVRPEDFEDADFAPEGHEGWTFEAPIELTESMGAEIYAHFDFEQQEQLDSEELRELQADAGTSDVPQASGAGHAVARVDSASSVKAGERSKLWLNTEKLHLFDPSDGHSMTRGSDSVGRPA